MSTRKRNTLIGVAVAAFALVLLWAYLAGSHFWSPKTYYYNQLYSGYDELVASAARGDADSMFALGSFHFNQSLDNCSEAFQQFRKAAELGHARAQYQLGVCYDYELGTECDLIEAFKWYRRAASQGDEAALVGIAGLILSNRHSLVRDEVDWPTDDNGDPILCGNYRLWLLKAHLLLDSPLANVKNQDAAFWKSYYSGLELYPQRERLRENLKEKNRKRNSIQARWERRKRGFRRNQNDQYTVNSLAEFLASTGASYDISPNRNIPFRSLLYEIRYDPYVAITLAGKEIHFSVEKSEWIHRSDKLNRWQLIMHCGKFLNEPMHHYVYYRQTPSSSAIGDRMLRLAQMGFSPAQRDAAIYMTSLDFPESYKKWMETAAAGGDLHARASLVLDDLRNAGGSLRLALGRFEQQLNEPDARCFDMLVERLKTWHEDDPAIFAQRETAVTFFADSRGSPGARVLSALFILARNNPAEAAARLEEVANFPPAAYLLGCLAAGGTTIPFSAPPSNSETDWQRHIPDGVSPAGLSWFLSAMEYPPAILAAASTLLDISPDSLPSPEAFSLDMRNMLVSLLQRDDWQKLRPCGLAGKDMEPDAVLSRFMEHRIYTLGKPERDAKKANEPLANILSRAAKVKWERMGSLGDAISTDETGRIKALLADFLVERSPKKRIAIIERIFVLWYASSKKMKYEGDFVLDAELKRQIMAASLDQSPTFYEDDELDSGIADLAGFLAAYFNSYTHYENLYAELNAPEGTRKVETLLKEMYSAGNKEDCEQFIADLAHRGQGDKYLELTAPYAAAAMANPDEREDGYGSTVFFAGRTVMHASELDPSKRYWYVTKIIIGTDNDDKLRARHMEALFGGPGDDVLHGGRGGTLLHGGPGNDTLTGENRGSAYLWGRGDGNDTILNPNRADDVIYLYNLTEKDVAIVPVPSETSLDMRIIINDTEESLLVTPGSYEAPGSKDKKAQRLAIKKIVFVDGKEKNRSELEHILTVQMNGK